MEVCNYNLVSCLCYLHIDMWAHTRMSAYVPRIFFLNFRNFHHFLSLFLNHFKQERNHMQVFTIYYFIFSIHMFLIDVYFCRVSLVMFVVKHIRTNVLCYAIKISILGSIIFAICVPLHSFARIILKDTLWSITLLQTQASFLYLMTLIMQELRVTYVFFYPNKLSSIHITFIL